MVCIVRSKKKNTLVSGNPGDEKNLHPDGRKFIYFWSIFLWYPLFFFCFFCFICILAFLLLVCLFFEIKNILIHIQQCGRMNDKKVFTLLISGNKATFFVASAKLLYFLYVSNVILPLKKILLKALIVNIEFFLRDRHEILLLMSE